ncbi:MAG: FtsX-like permease family protein [Candidatus Sumerlaeota bacterium]|nr:FtsX-like permease family protein [Candidatus Sumerlaeota bacterium]
MTLSHYVIRSALRNRRRTALTVLSVGFSLFLLIVLWTVLGLLRDPSPNEDADLRLAVRRATSLADCMPFAYLEKLRQVPHVKRALPFVWFGGYYLEPRNFFPSFASDPGPFWGMFPAVKTSDEAKRAFAEEKMAAIAGRELADRYGWNVGDRVTLTGTIYPVDLDFHIVGIYESDVQQRAFYFRYDCLDEALGGPGLVSAFWLQADSADSIPEIMDTVDAMFHNSPAETRTETEKAFVLGFVSMLGNVRLVVASVASVVVFSILLVAYATMAMSIRERQGEIAILKALGYRRRTLFALLVSEGVFLALLGGAWAALAAMALGAADVYALTHGFLERFAPTPLTYGMTFLTGALIGALAGLPSALRVSRISVVEAIRRAEG